VSTLEAPPEAIAPFAARMRAARQPELAIRTFAHYYAQLRAGATGLLPESALAPPGDLPDAETFGAYEAAGRAALSRAVVIKLNGGLGTGMGMTRAKSLLPVKDGRSFLAITAGQILALRASSGADLPLVLMDSFRTREDSLAALAAIPGLDVGLPLDFLQHQVPKVRVRDLAPAEHPTDPELTWCPPGHGDIYTALSTSGMLETLLARGLRWAFVANADNLGAVLDLSLLGYVAESGLSFVMEVADRTEADRKGGHLARLRGGGLVLRESAQCPPEDEAAFQDVARYRYFNTNNLWIDLEALDAALRARAGILDLPLIRNAKPLDPSYPGSEPVYQLETAMGSAISVFDGAAAVRVPRTRFAPVKTTSDLLALWSDAYVRTEDERVVLAPERDERPVVVDLDPRYYRLIGDLEARFPAGAPSLRACERLSVHGDVVFGAGVVCRGAVTVRHEGPVPLRIADNTVLGG